MRDSEVAREADGEAGEYEIAHLAIARVAGERGALARLGHCPEEVGQVFGIKLMSACPPRSVPGRDRLDTHDGVRANDVANGGPGADSSSTDPRHVRRSC